MLDTVDVGAVRRAVTALARRHDGLHTTFVEEGGRFFQRIDPEMPVPLTLTALPLTAAVTGAETWVRKRFDAMLAEPFDRRRVRCGGRSWSVGPGAACCF